MLKKLSIVALILIGGTGAYALVANLFPDTVDFPRIPTGPGTIGYVLTKFFGPNLDGTGDAPNTLALSGMSASGYVQSKDCTNPGEVWLGIDANGIPQCGYKGTMLAFAILTDTGSVAPIVIKHADNTTEDGHIGMMLAVGDMVSTPLGGSATIGFTTDDSVVRLDADTSIEIQAGVLDGRTVAQVNLDNGLLWGRVLTSTGMSFGAGGYIAGVRGTSIAMRNDKTNVAIIVPHSMRDTDAVTVTNSGAPVGMNVFTGSAGMKLENLYVPHPYISPSGTPTSPKEDLYDTSMSPLMAEWITLNTRKDVVYLDILYESGSVSASRKLFASGELLVTLPPPNSIECTNLLTGSTVKVDETSLATEEVSAVPIESSVKTEVCAIPTSKSIRCGSQGLVWWPSVNRCGPLAGAFADLTQSSTLFLKNGNSLEARYETGSMNGNILPDGAQFGTYQYGANLNPSRSHVEWRNDTSRTYKHTLWHYLAINGGGGGGDCETFTAKNWIQGVYVKDPFEGMFVDIGLCSSQYKYNGGVWYLSGIINHIPGQGVPITSPGQYLTYPINSLGNIAGFTGGALKNSTIKIEISPGIPTPPSPGKAYVFDFGNWKAYIDSSGNAQIQRPLGVTTGSFTCNPGKTECSLVITTAPTQMIIGAFLYNGNYIGQIGTTIKKITISN